MTKSATHFGAREFVAEVCNAAREAIPSNVKISVEADDRELSNDLAMPLALILNELLINAGKHGARGENAEIRTRLLADGDDFVLSVEDDGPGFELQVMRSRVSGLGLVQGLAQQLRGEFQVSRNPTRCSVRFRQIT